MVVQLLQGLAVVAQGKLRGVINKQGQEVVPLQFDYVEIFGLVPKVLVERQDKYGVYDDKGHLIIPLNYDGLSITYNNFDPQDYQGYSFIAHKEDKYGLFNEEGQLIVPLEYDYIYRFEEGLLKVSKDGEHYLINAQGQRAAVEAAQQ